MNVAQGEVPANVTANLRYRAQLVDVTAYVLHAELTAVEAIPQSVTVAYCASASAEAACILAVIEGVVPVSVNNFRKCQLVPACAAAKSTDASAVDAVPLTVEYPNEVTLARNADPVTVPVHVAAPSTEFSTEWSVSIPIIS